MALNTWGFVYTLGTDATSERRDEIGSDGCRLIAIGVPDVSLAAQVAVDLANDGCELIEFCGAFGAAAISDVLDAVGGRDLPVGVVSYGGDATNGLHRIFGEPDRDRRQSTGKPKTRRATLQKSEKWL